ncbi:hypothetical protein GOV05_00915 [Candidatus Woesearchaeota archaeon]|nr:hypothetical protein [Candidatus Woesearchaeota archaeon]
MYAKKKESKDTDFYKITTLVLLGIIVVMGGVWAYGKYAEARDAKINEYLNAGYNQGITDSLVQIYQGTNECQITTINLGNTTRRVADVACLEQVLTQQQGQQPAQQ